MVLPEQQQTNPRVPSAHYSFSDALIRFSQDHLRGEAPHYVPYLLAAFNHQSALRYYTCTNILLSASNARMPPTFDPLWAHKGGVLIPALILVVPQCSCHFSYELFYCYLGNSRIV